MSSAQSCDRSLLIDEVLSLSYITCYLTDTKQFIDLKDSKITELLDLGLVDTNYAYPGAPALAELLDLAGLAINNGYYACFYGFVLDYGYDDVAVVFSGLSVYKQTDHSQVVRDSFFSHKSTSTYFEELFSSDDGTHTLSIGWDSED